MQRNTAKIVKQLNYEAVEVHLLSLNIISFDERRDLTNKTSREQKLFVIEKVSKGTEETFNNFVKALQESEDNANYELMLHIQQSHKKEDTSLKEHYCMSESLNTPCGSMTDELVFGEMSFQAQFSLKGNNKTETKILSCNTKYAIHNGLPNQSTKRPVPTIPKPEVDTAPHLQNIFESSSDSWVFVCSQTNITYNKSLSLLMAHICDNVIESLAGTNCVQSTCTQLNNINVSIKLLKEIYSEADPKTETPTTQAADIQIKQSYKELMKILHKLQSKSHPRIIINLDPIMKKIHYTPNQVIVSDHSIEGLIHIVNKLNHGATNWPCVIL